MARKKEKASEEPRREADPHTNDAPSPFTEPDEPDAVIGDEGGEEQEQSEEEKFKFCTVDSDTIIDGEVKDVGSELELTRAEAENYRSRGVALTEVQEERQ